MLFHPGAFLQVILTVVFFALVLVGCFSGSKLYTIFVTGKVYLLQRQVEQLTKELEQCKVQLGGMDDREAFYKKNIAILKRSASRKTKPVVEDQIYIERLFNVDPR